MTNFTQAEHDFLTAAFSKLTVNLADPQAPDTTKLARNILDKVEALKEKENGEQHPGVQGRTEDSDNS